MSRRRQPIDDIPRETRKRNRKVAIGIALLTLVLTAVFSLVLSRTVFRRDDMSLSSEQSETIDTETADIETEQQQTADNPTATDSNAGSDVIEITGGDQTGSDVPNDDGAPRVSLDGYDTCLDGVSPLSNEPIDDVRLDVAARLAALMTFSSDAEYTALSEIAEPVLPTDYDNDANVVNQARRSGIAMVFGIDEARPTAYGTPVLVSHDAATSTYRVELVYSAVFTPLELGEPVSTDMRTMNELTFSRDTGKLIYWTCKLL